MSRSQPDVIHRPIVEALEAKLLYSADIAPTAFLASELSQAPSTPAAHAGVELVFIDASVPDLGTLMADLSQQQAAGRSITVVLIRDNEDGLTRIADTLSQQEQVSAIHLMGHGTAGSMQLGSTVLDRATMLQRASELAGWSSALTADADILLYGCDVAGDPVGRSLVHDLSLLTGADVAASNDPTGCLAAGGDWQLEVTEGTIDAAIALSAQGQQQWQGVLGLSTASSKGAGVWAENGFTGPQGANWDGLSLGSQANTALSSTWTVVTSATSPTRDESIVIGVDGNGVISGQIWNGSQWTALSLNPLASGTDGQRQGFAVAYEQISGDAVLVWSNGSTLQCSVFNGSTWTTPQTVAAYTGATPTRMQIASQAGGDGLALVISDANADDRALIWNGQQWGHAITLDTTGSNVNDQLPISVAYESNSGRAMVAYTKGSTGNLNSYDHNVYYRLFSASGWSAEAVAGNYTEPAAPYSLFLASDPHSNRIAFAMNAEDFQSFSSYLIYSSFAVWDGSTWGARQLQSYTVNSVSVMGSSAAVAFESQSGDALAVWGTNASTLSYKTWSHTTNTWGSSTTAVTLSAPVQVVRLYADPVSDHLIAGVNTTGGALSYSDWNGDTWVTTSTVASNTGSTSTPAFTWLWQNPHLDVSANDLWVGSSQDTTGWKGVNAVSDTEMLSFGGANLQFGNSTSGSFSHLFDLGTYGVNGLDDIAWVSRDVALAGGTLLQRGDVLFTVSNNGTLSSGSSSVSVNNNDVILFRPTTPDDMSRGTFTVIVQGLGSGFLGLGNTPDIRGLALVEQDVVMGDATLHAGDLVFSMGNGSTGSDVYLFSPSSVDVLTGLISGNTSTLLRGSDININKVVTGLEVISATTALKNMTLPSGSLLMSFEQGTSVGTTPTAIGAQDIALVTPSATSISGGTTVANAQKLFSGSSLAMSTSAIFDSLALYRQTPPSITNQGGGPTASYSINENTTAVTTIEATDPDSNTVLSYRIVGGADANLFNLLPDSGQLSFVSAPDREQPGDSNQDNVYEVVVAASDGDVDDTQALYVTVLNVNEAPVIDSDGGETDASLTVIEGQTSVTQVHASDLDSTSLSYAIVGGADAALFTISSASGQLSFIQAATSAPQDADGNGVYEVTVAAQDGTLSDQQQLHISIRALNRPPVNTLPGALSMVEDASMSFSGMQVSDVDAGSATIRVTFSVQHGTLNVVSTAPGGLTGSDIQYSPDQRTVVLEGDLAHINATLSSAGALTYTPDANVNGSDTLTMVSDDLGNSGAPDTPQRTTDTDTMTITVTAVNDAPTVVMDAGQLTFREGDGPLSISPGLGITDIDSTAITSATVRISSGYVSAQDMLSVSTSGGITASWSGSTGTLTLSGTAPLGDYETVLRTLTYSNASQQTTSGDRVVSVTVNDGSTTSAHSTPVSRRISVTGVNDAPTLTWSGSALTYREDDGDAVLAPGIVIGDEDNSTLSGATVRFTSGYAQGEDTLNWVTNGSILASWSESTGELILQGPGTLSDYQAVLQSIRYRNDSQTPSPQERTIEITVDDGQDISPAMARSIQVQPVNDPPTLSISGTNTTYTENAPPTSLGGVFTITDVDSGSLMGATVQISSGYVAGRDQLTLAPTGAISASWDAIDGRLTLSGAASLADYEAALSQVQFLYDGEQPDAVVRTLTIQVDDGAASSNASSVTMTLVAVNDAPGLTADTDTLDYTEGQIDLPLVTGITISDVDDTLLSQATVRIGSGYTSGEDLLTFTDQGAITGHWDADTGTMTLQGLASQSAYQTALSQISYRNLSDTPSTAAREIVLIVQDPNTDNAQSLAVRRELLVHASDDAPTISGSGTSLTYDEQSTTGWIDTQIQLGDLDNDTLQGATVQITNAYRATQDRLVLDPTGVNSGITGTWDENSGTLTLSGEASLADYQTALRQVRYQNIADAPDTADRTVVMRVDDGTLPSAEHTLTIQVRAVNDAPTLDVPADPPSHIENGPSVLIAADAVLDDVDNAIVQHITVSISQGYRSGQDILSMAPQARVTAQWDDRLATLTLQANGASASDMQAALRSVGYVNLSEAPDTQDRSISITASDGDLSSATITRIIGVVAINDAPVLHAANTTLHYVEASGPVTLNAGIELTDVDSDTLQSATIRLIGHVPGQGDQLFYAGTSGITGHWDDQSGTLTLQGQASLDDYRQALDSISYDNSSQAPIPLQYTLSYSVSDGQDDSATDASTQAVLNITTVNDAPAIILNSLSIQQGGQAQPRLTIADPDSSPDQLTITVNFVTGGQFIDLSRGLVVTSFTASQLADGGIVFQQDGSSTAPDYQLTVSDGQSATSAPPPTVTMSVAPPPATAPAPQVNLTPPPTVQDDAPSPEEHNNAEPSVSEAHQASHPAATDARPTATQDETMLPRREDVAVLSGMTSAPAPMDLNIAAPVLRIQVDTRPHAGWGSVSAEAASDEFTYHWTGSLQAGGTAEDLNRSLEALREQLTDNHVGRQQVIASSIAVSTGLSMGYVIWLLRGGALLGSMLSSMPLWNMIDPLPVLNRSSGKGAGSDGSDRDASVERLFDGDQGDGAQPPPTPDRDAPHVDKETPA